MKTKLIFFTNIPTPYQLDFFDALSEKFQLTVVFYALTESNRQWNIDLSTEKYEIIVLKDNWVAKLFQSRIVDFHFSFDIIDVLRDRNFDHVILGGTYWIPNGIYAILWSKRRKLKVAYFTEATYLTNSKLKFLIKKRMLKFLSDNVDYIFGIGQRAIESFRHFGVFNQAYNIPYNINVERFKNSVNEEYKLKIQNRFLTKNDKVFITSCALIERKGVDLIINAFKKNLDPNSKLLIIGDGPLKNELELLSSSDNRIKFLGFVAPSELPSIFSLADFFIFGSRYDGWAVVIMEAIAFNLTIISSDMVGAAQELIESNKNGILCKSGSIESFKEAVNFCISAPTEVDEMKKNMQKKISAIDSNAIADKVYQIFTNK